MTNTFSDYDAAPSRAGQHRKKPSYQAAVRVLVHAAGGPAWTGEARVKKRQQIEATEGGRFLCGIQADPRIVEAVNRIQAPLGVWRVPEVIYGELEPRMMEVDRAPKVFADFASNTAARMMTLFPAVLFEVAPCPRCLANLTSMRAADIVRSTEEKFRREREAARAASEVRAPSLPREHTPSTISVPTSTRKPEDPRQVRANERIAREAAQLKSALPKPKTKGKAK